MAKITTASLFVGLAGLILLAACSSSDHVRKQRDLCDPEDGYELIGYQPQHRQQRSLYLAGVRDARGTLEAFRDGVYPVAYTRDEIWRRPVPTMVEDLLRSEIHESGLFASLPSKESEADWKLCVDLLEFHGGIEERPRGRHAFGRCTLQARIYGPKDASGKRSLLRKERFEEELRSEGSLMLPDPHGLAAACFRRANYRLLVDLDRGGRLADQRGAEENEARASEPEKREWSAAPKR
ncbi:MAG: hypothetical protein CSA62_12070 [Planctomycetota bacterium]|nr:MAG: hypothetical protein CSA62_12070 [Planctomycetota bacterium]